MENILSIEKQQILDKLINKEMDYSDVDKSLWLDKDFLIAVIKNVASERDLIQIIKYGANYDKGVIITIFEFGPSHMYSIWNYILSEEHKKDGDIVLAAYRNGSIRNLSSLDRSLMEDKEFILKALDKKAGFYFYASDNLKNDKEIILAAIKADEIPSISILTEEQKDDYDIALAACLKHDWNIQYVSDRLKNDKRFVLNIIGLGEIAVEQIGDKLKDDEEIALLMAVTSYDGLSKVSDRLKNDREFVLKAVSVSKAPALGIVNSKFSNDLEVVSLAVQNNGYSLGYANAILRDNKELVMQAVAKNGGVLKYVSERLKKDEDVVLTACNNAWGAIEYASEELYANPEFKNKIASIRLEHEMKYIELAEVAADRCLMCINEDEELSAAMSEELKQEFKSLMIKYILDDFLSLHSSHHIILEQYRPGIEVFNEFFAKIGIDHWPLGRLIIKEDMIYHQFRWNENEWEWQKNNVALDKIDDETMKKN